MKEFYGKIRKKRVVFFLEPITYYFCGFFSQNTPADMDDLKERVEDLEVEMSKIAKGGGGSAAVPVAAGAAAGGLGGAAAGAALAEGVPEGGDTASMANGVGAAAGGVGGAMGEEIGGIKKDLDRIMGRSGEETDEIEGVPSLVSVDLYSLFPDVDLPPRILMRGGLRKVEHKEESYERLFFLHVCPAMGGLRMG